MPDFKLAGALDRPRLLSSEDKAAPCMQHPSNDQVRKSSCDISSAADATIVVGVCLRGRRLQFSAV
jgi:hypothetical protein